MLLKPPGRGVGVSVDGGGAVEMVAASWVLTGKEFPAVTGSIVPTAGSASVDGVSCFNLASLSAFNPSSILIAVSGIRPSSSITASSSLLPFASLLGDHCMSGGAEDGPGDTASEVDV